MYEDRSTPGTLGEPRKAHYGAGRQPWDIILDAGWAPEYAAGNVLKYMRRTKDPEHSLESARWFYARLYEMMVGRLLPTGAVGSPRRISRVVGRAAAVMVALNDELTADEKKVLAPS